MTPDSVRCWEVTGLVQGVGFRWFVSRHARRLGVGGWVRNSADGSVCILALGSEEALSELRKAVERGPDRAHVLSVTETPPAEGPAPTYPFSVVP